MSNVFRFRDAIVAAAKSATVDDLESGQLLAAAIEFYLGLQERMVVRDVVADRRPEASPQGGDDINPVFEGSDVPGPERAPVPALEPEREWPEVASDLVEEDGVASAPDAPVPILKLEACGHCGKNVAAYCKQCYHERFARKTVLGTAHKPPDGYALLATRWCTESDGVREGYETIDGVVSAWAQADDAKATFFVLERVPSEAPGTYRVYIYSNVQQAAMSSDPDVM